MIPKHSPTTTNPRSDRPRFTGLKRISLALAVACLTGAWTVPSLAQEPAAKPALGETPYGGLKYKMPEIMLISWANWPEKQEDRDAVAALMKAKGFNAAETTLEGLEALRKHGMYARLGTPEFEVAPKLRNDPNVLAYFISDRRTRGSFPKFEQMTRAFEKQDPTHPTMINNRANYNQFPEFVEVVKPTMLVYYHYQFRKGEHQERNLIYLDMFRKLALKQNIPLVRCTDAKQLPGHLRHEHFTSLAYGVQGFTYSPCHHFGFKKEEDGKITPTFGEFFEPLSQVALDIRTLSPILVKLKSIDVFHAEPLPPGGRKAPEDSWVAIAGAHTFTGIFKDEAGKDFLFPVNNDPGKEHETTLALKGATAAERMDKKTGKWIPLTVTPEGDRGIVKVTLAPGDGELLKIVRK